MVRGVTAVVTNHNYAHYLPECIESALRYCEEVLVYDDGSTDNSLALLEDYPVRVIHRDDPSGDPVWGSNLGIEQATCSHLVFLDADNYLLRRPPQEDYDYLFADIQVINPEGVNTKVWRYAGWPLTAEGCWEQFLRQRNMPFPWGGVWRTAWLRDKRWRNFDDTILAADFRTALDWCKARPTLGHSDAPFLAFRRHPAQQTAVTEGRQAMYDEVTRIAETESM